MRRRSRSKLTSGRAVVRSRGNAHCLNILRQLSDYLDQDLTVNVCDEIRRHLGACPNCELFVDSLRQTVSLCNHAAPPRLSASAKAQLRRKILQAAGQSR